MKYKPTGRPPQPTDRRFWSKVKVTNASDNLCWEWQYSTDNKMGYGRFQAFGENYAHRVSWILEYGNIPDELRVLPKCDNARCVRPSHLFLGTLKDNMQDMIAKGRNPDRRGELNPQAKLDWKTVDLIRDRLNAGERQYIVADSMNLVRQTVHKIWHNEIWRCDE